MRTTFFSGILWSLLLLVWSVSPAHAVVLTFDLGNDFAGDGVQNPAGFLFTFPDRYYFDFNQGNIQLEVDFVNANLGQVTISGTAPGREALGTTLQNPNPFVREDGDYQFDFSIDVIRVDAFTFVTNGQSSVGTITNPLGESVVFDLMFNHNPVYGYAFGLLFGPDYQTVAVRSWLIGGGLSGDFHSLGIRIPNQPPSEVPEPSSIALLCGGLLALGARKRKA